MIRIAYWKWYDGLSKEEQEQEDREEAEQEDDVFRRALGQCTLIRRRKRFAFTATLFFSHQRSVTISMGWSTLMSPRR